jgi:hypothetical protein
MGALLLKVQRAGKALSAIAPMHPVERRQENHADPGLSIRELVRRECASAQRFIWLMVTWLMVRGRWTGRAADAA